MGVPIHKLFHICKGVFPKKEQGKKPGGNIWNASSSSSQCSECEATVKFSVVGPLRLPIPFTLSFLYQGQHCQLKQSLYLAALFAGRAVWSLLLEQFKVAKKQIDRPNRRRHCLKAQSHFVLLLTFPSCKGELNCFKNMLFFSMEIPEYAIHSLPVSDGDLKALTLPLLRKCPKSPSSLRSFLGPFSYKSVMLYMERDKRSVTLWCSDIQFGLKINSICEYCCWEVSSWCEGFFWYFIYFHHYRPD